MKIYVGNLSYDATEQDVRQAFENFGTVGEVILIEDRFSGRPKGFGFVEMPEEAEANRAIEEMNGQEILGRPVRVNKAHPRRERAPRRGGRGGGDDWGGGGRSSF